MLEQFKLNIFINGLVIGLSEFAAYPVCYFMITKVTRKATSYGCFAISYVCSLILIFVWKQGSQEEIDIGNSIGILALIFVNRFAITCIYTIFYVQVNELYPTQVRVLGGGLFAAVGGFAVAFIPEFIDLCVQYGVSIMALFAIMSGISGYSTKYLPETLNVPPPE